MRQYAVAAVVINSRLQYGNVFLEVACIGAHSEAEAIGKVLAKLYEKYPASMGYTTHMANAMLVPEQIIRIQVIDKP